LAFKNYIHYALSFFEILERFHWTENEVGPRVSVEGGQHVWRALAHGKGFFFLTAHLGNWELITRVGVILRFPLSIVTKSLRNPVADELWKMSRKKYGLDLLKESGSGISIIKGIQRGRAIGFIFDQFTGKPHGVKAKFLGLNTMCPKALSLMAPRLGAPIIPAYLIREKNGHLKLHIEAALNFDDLDPKDPDFSRKHIQRCNENLEKWVERYPEQFLWIHKRFKDTINYKTHKLPWEL
jgi:KDO2-lipid IV(A) lauroyltransferase